MRRLVLLLAPLLMAGCSVAETVSPELACQRRLAAAREAEPTPGDDFNHQAYARVDRTGCSGKQLAALDGLVALTKALPALNEANSRAKDQATIAATFHPMNDAVIKLNELEQAVRADLARIEAPQ